MHDHSDLFFITNKINNPGCIDDRFVCSLSKRHSPGVSLDKFKPATRFSVSNHLGTQIDAIRPKSFLAQLCHDQALTCTYD